MVQVHGCQRSLFKLWGGGLLRPWDPVPEESYHHLGLSPMIPNKLWTCRDSGTVMVPSWYTPMVVNGVVVGLFEEEEEGTDVTSDVVKVEGEDPAAPGPLT